MRYASARNFVFENIILYVHFFWGGVGFVCLFAKCVLLHLLKANTDWKKYLKDVHI